MEWVYMFTGNPPPMPDFDYVNDAEYLARFDLKGALGFLDAIAGRVATELPERPTAYYSALRHVFAELDGLGQLYAGDESGKKNLAQHAVDYGEKYMGAVDARYRDLFGLLFDLYRHGLAHTGLIVQAHLQGRHARLGWALHHGADHLKLPTPPSALPDGTQLFNLWVSVPQFRADAVASVQAFKTDLQTSGQNSPLFEQFRRGYYGIAVVRHPKTPKASKPSPAAPKSAFNAAHVETNDYSTPGFTWIDAELTKAGY